jgi:hypothetical protein
LYCIISWGSSAVSLFYENKESVVIDKIKITINLFIIADFLSARYNID